LKVQPGERLGILGASGAGKSSLAALISGQIGADSGMITINSRPVDAIDPASLRQHIAYLTQQTDLFSTSIAGNLRIAQPNASEQAIREALEAVALDEFVRSCPAGLDTWVGESGTELSAGQRRRLALARLLLRDPSIVILDEPFSGLDSETAEHIACHLQAWSKGRTMLLLGHDREALPAADRWLVLRNGQLRLD